MSKMTWHTAGTKKFQAGVSEVALFVMNDNGTYNSGVPWNGVTAINENPSGADITDLYADDEKYASLQAAEKFGFSIEAYDYPDEWEDCDGSKVAKYNNTEVPGVYLGQQQRKAFGLVYKTKIGDETHPGLDRGYRLHIVYNSIASPSSRSYATVNENPDAISMSWDANSTPIEVGTINNVKYKDLSTIVIDSTKCSYIQAIEDIIYGTANSDPTMPTPLQVYNGSLT